MRALVALLLVIHCRAAAIQGVVVDDETGNPLSWAQIRLVPLPGAKAAPVAARAGERGTFSIPNAGAGWYVLRTVRDGYADTEVGQMRAGRPGTPFEIVATDRLRYFQVRMRPLGSITGSVLDENNVGIADWPVIVYTAHKPVRRVAAGLTDERGFFRVGLLEAGMYVVRSGAGTLEDGAGLLPTFFKYGTEFGTAEPMHVRVGETRQDVVIRPQKGRLLELRGVFTGPSGAFLTLVTETGRRTLVTVLKSGAPIFFDAKGVAPGPIELIASGQDCGGYSRMTADRDTALLRESCVSLSRPVINWSLADGSPLSRQFPVLIRRADLDGAGPAHPFSAGETLPPGRWEVMPQVSADYYVVSVGSGLTSEGWFTIEGGKIDIVVSAHPATLSGTISSGGMPVSGAMVYLEMFDPERGQARLRLWSVRADSQGIYRFEGLAPGHYHVLSSFDFDPDSASAMNNAIELVLHEADKATQPLEMVLP